MQTHGLHHVHKKKRKKSIKAWDTFMLYVGMIGPLFILPQVIKIYTEQQAVGVSFISWFALGVVSLLWVIYGCLHKEKPLIINYLIFTLLNFAVALGVILYG